MSKVLPIGITEVPDADIPLGTRNELLVWLCECLWSLGLLHPVKVLPQVRYFRPTPGGPRADSLGFHTSETPSAIWIEADHALGELEQVAETVAHEARHLQQYLQLTQAGLKSGHDLPEPVEEGLECDADDWGKAQATVWETKRRQRAAHETKRRERSSVA